MSNNSPQAGALAFAGVLPFGSPRSELPGMKREDVNVELRGNELRITGEVKEEQAGKILRHRHGKFAYRSSLPADADSDKIDAELADGILTVRLPKATQARSRRIEIKG